MVLTVSKLMRVGDGVDIPQEGAIVRGRDLYVDGSHLGRVTNLHIQPHEDAVLFGPAARLVPPSHYTLEYEN